MGSTNIGQISIYDDFSVAYSSIDPTIATQS
jgi:hypothetical protein